MSTESFAKLLFDFGANVLAIEAGKKKPVGEWRPWITQRQTWEDIESSDWSRADKVGIVNGIGHWRNLDIDKSTDQFIVAGLLEKLGLPADYKWLELSLSGNGYHLWFLCESEYVEGFPKFPENDQPGVIVGTFPTGGELELRWRGNQTAVAGSLDPSRWVNGEPTEKPLYVDSKAVAGAFLSVAVPKERKERPTEFVGRTSEDKPGDDFNTRGRLQPFLENKGWVMTDRIGEVEYWRRPGKNSGSASATLNYYPGLFFVFSSNAEPFLHNQGYSLFAAYAMLEHNGDWTQAGKALHAMGFGKYPALEGMTPEQIDILRGGRLKYRYSDYGNAEVFEAIYGDRYKFDKKRRDGWMYWDGVAWREDERGRIEQDMLFMIRQRGQAAFTISDDAQKDDAAKWAIRSESGKGYREALMRVQTMPSIVSVTNDYDANPFLITVNGATINLKTGEQYVPRKEDMITKVANVRFDPEAECPLWLSFLNDVFEGDKEVIRYVQKCIGMSLSGDISEQAFFICFGQGANGKSTFLNTIRKVLGDYASTTSFGTFDADSRNEYGNDVAALKGRRVVVAIEAEQSKRLAEARIKTITGGDLVSCRFLYGEFFEYLPTYKVWLAVNHKPSVRGADHGIWRRLHYIPFNVRFGGEGNKPRDNQLESKLDRERAGIFNWMLEGFNMWQSDGHIKKPASILAATEEFQNENDSVARFIAECCERNDNATMEAGEAYTLFRAWLSEQGEAARFIPNMTFWGHRMSEKGLQKGKNSRGRIIYKGIGLREITVGIGKN
jgi:putative DNA primase/helicase